VSRMSFKKYYLNTEEKNIPNNSRNFLVQTSSNRLIWCGKIRLPLVSVGLGGPMPLCPTGTLLLPAVLRAWGVGYFPEQSVPTHFLNIEHFQKKHWPPRELHSQTWSSVHSSFLFCSHVVNTRSNI
jgi:hypothetical protein